MKRGNILILIISILVLSSLIPNFVSAERPYYSPLGDSVEEEDSWSTPLVQGNTVWDPVADMFSNWSEGRISINIAKYIFFFMIFIILFAVAGFLPFFEGEKTFGIRVIFSLLVAFLATAYITPEEVFVLLTSYTALGLAIGSIIPFIFLFFLTVKASEKGGPVVFLQYFSWLAFTTWMVYKFILLVGGDRPDFVGVTVLWIHGILTLIGVSMIAFNRQIRNLMEKQSIAETKQAIFSEIEKEDIVRKADKKRFEKMRDRALGK